MEKYQINTKYGTVYQIDSDGCFLQYNQHNWQHPHNTWKCTGCAEILPFGHLRFHSLRAFLKMIKDGIKFTFKNGKPKFTLTDLDHGTNRVHGNTAYHGISKAYQLV